MSFVQKPHDTKNKDKRISLLEVKLGLLKLDLLEHVKLFGPQNLRLC